jgi:hypothetical protein
VVPVARTAMYKKTNEWRRALTAINPWHIGSITLQTLHIHTMCNVC